MNRNCRRKTEKVYVKVNSDFDATGYQSKKRLVVLLTYDESSEAA